ncbi:hypothetical protein U3516DRAFT_835435 [Neocallimastix sp. 'constans']
MTNICSKLCVDNLIFLEGYINKCQNGMVFIQKLCKNYMQINFKNPRRIVTQYYSRKQARKLSTKRKWSCVNLSRLVGMLNKCREILSNKIVSGSYCETGKFYCETGYLSAFVEFTYN